ncbi:DUF2510 domain-containing protein [Mycobacterium gordonae]|nr:DUF2510 domain-containing protein [Mycobacterium gordonae]MCV7006753.1 DUF2510 domain-containing protein [Mycobacterium gordonae]
MSAPAPPPPSPPPGWYPDPADPRAELLWDGRRWRLEMKRPVHAGPQVAGVIAPGWAPASGTDMGHLAPVGPSRLRRSHAGIYFWAGTFVVLVATVVIIIWGASTHGFRDMHSYNLGRQAGIWDKGVEPRRAYRVGCDRLLEWANKDEHGRLNSADFLAGCWEAEG